MESWFLRVHGENCMAWNMIEVAKTFFDTDGQKRCGYCLGAIERDLQGRCEYCGTKIANPLRTIAQVGMAVGALPILQRMFDKLGMGPFGLFPKNKKEKSK